jgi:putative hydrolase of the HAD superfamily
MFSVDFEKIKNEKVKAILLDLDNTLYKYEPCHQYALKNCWQYFQKDNPISFAQFKKNYKLARRDVKKYTFGQAASHSRFLYFQRFLEKTHGKTDTILTVELEELYWNNFFKKMKLFNGAFVFLKECRKNNIKVCLITDLTAKIQFKKINHFKISEYLDFIVSSEEAGRDKPHQNIFRLALQKLKMRPRDVVLIGDDYNKDLAGGEKMGIKTILLK